jgi:hypothetical protein
MASARSIPAAMGLPACRVDRARDIAPAIEDGIASKTANLVELDRKARLKRCDGLCRLPATRRPLRTIERGLVMFGIAERRGFTRKPAARHAAEASPEMHALRVCCDPKD